MITTKVAPCWVPADADGKPIEHNDAVTHSGTEQAAKLDISTSDYHGRAVRPVQLPDVCYVALTECGEAYENGDGGGEHFHTAEDAERALIVEGYAVPDGVDGVVLCPDAGDSECGCLTAAGLRGAGPTPVLEGR